MVFQEDLIKSLTENASRIAIEEGDTRISYAQLLSKANAISHFLLNLGLEPETLVGVQLKGRASIIISLIGVINARCVVVPVDPALPGKRRNVLLRDANLKYLITARDSVGVEQDPGVECLFIEDIVSWPVAHAAPALPTCPRYNGEDSLYVYFTSGSTGVPKGVVGKNSSLLQFLRWEIRSFGIGNTTRVSQFISPYFDAFLRDVFVPLLTGGTICLHPPEEDFFTSEKLIDWIDANDIHLIHCVPSLFRVVNAATLSPDRFGGLRNVLLSGEKIIPAELANWYAVFGNRIQLVNLYGATETTMIRSWYKIQPEDVSLARIPIGAPIDDTEFLIANKGLKSAGLLVPGALYIISDYTAKGYLNSPELTHRRFVKIKSAAQGEKTAFKTGDVARMVAHNKIELLGREDRQVKLNGIRIDLDEIENVVLKSGLVNQVLVVAEGIEAPANAKGPTEAGTPKLREEASLSAFIIRGNHVPDHANVQEDIRQHLQSHLPAYMVPGRIAEVEAFPLLGNGKINVNALLNAVAPSPVKVPGNAIEHKLLLAWKEILGDKPISVDESFLGIGGNSLAIMRLIGKIYKVFNTRISLSELFNNLSIEKQAICIGNAQKDQVLEIKKAAVKPAYALTAAQERIYYSYQMNKASTAYNLPMAWKIEGAYDRDRLETALGKLIERHETLRTYFTVEDGRLLQVVQDEVQCRVADVRVRGNQLDEAVAAFVKPFDLSKAPLMRCAVLSGGEQGNFLLFDTHHIICDGMSQNNLYADFLKLYNGENLQPLRFQYKDYAEWENDFRISEEYIANRGFWLKCFEGEIPQLQLPVLNAMSSSGSGEGGNLSFEISAATINGIIAHAKKGEVTPFATLFSLFFMYLSQLSGQEDIVVGINTAGRQQEGLEDVVGMFTKTLPIRYKMNADMPFLAFVGDIHNTLVQAHSRQIYDLSDIVRELNASKPEPVKSLFSAMLVFQNFDGKKVQADGVEFLFQEFENKTAKYPITLFVSEGENAFSFRLEYLSAFFTAADVMTLATQFVDLVKRVSQTLDAPLVELIDGHFQLAAINEEDIEFNF